jgi:hypothetical protein
MLNLYVNQDELIEKERTDYTYLYLGGIIGISFLLGPYVAATSGLGSVGYLYYKNYSKQCIKTPKQDIELTSIYICKNN